MDIIWFRLLLSELLFPQLEPTIAYEDNSAVITAFTINVVKVPGTDNVADIYTKPLAQELFTKHRSTLLGFDLIQ